MLIKSIEIENFRQFRGKSRIDFSTDKDHTVSIILGQNTSGKTTLVRAFAWCLYGGTAEDLGFKKGSLLLNENEAIGLENSNPRYRNSRRVRVVLEIESQRGLDAKEEVTKDPILYRVDRTLEYSLEGRTKKIISQTPSIVIYKRVGHKNEEEIKDKKRIKEIINSILPKDLSEYFFYWGEKIENIKKKDLDKAVTGFTGIDEFTNAVEHIRQAVRMYKNQLLQSSSSLSVRQMQEDRDKAIREQQSIEESLVEIDSNIAAFEENLERLNEERYRLKNDRDALARKAEYERKKQDILKIIDDKQNSLIKEFNSSFASKCFVQKKAERLLKEVAEAKSEEERGWTEITVSAIQEIMRKGVCVCGQSLENRPDLMEHLHKEMAYALPNSLGGLISKTEAICENTRKYPSEYFNRITEFNKDIYNAKGDLKDVEEELNGIARIGSSEEELRALDQKTKEAQGNLQKEKNKRDTYVERLGKQKNLVNVINRKIDNYFKTEERNHLIQARIELAKAVEDIFTEEKKGREEEVRCQLQTYTQNYLNEMYHGERIIEVSKNFQIKVINEVNGVRRENDTSPGFETVKNFAFVCALITIAKNVVEQRGGNTKNESDMSEPYPLVLDAPFSQTDRDHVLKICGLVSKIAEQTILVMMEKDWEVAEEVLGNQIGMQYVLSKQSETVTRIEVYKDDAD